MNCELLTSAFSFVRSGSGRSRKNLKFSRSASRSGAWATMSRDLCRGFALSLAGQTTAQRLQPVQSSGATWIVYFIPLNSGAR